MDFSDVSKAWVNFPMEITADENIVLKGGTSNFGTTNINSGTLSKTFTITNLGSSSFDLQGSPIAEITGDNANQFSIDLTETATTLASGASTSFSVTFAPTSAGEKNATIGFRNVSDCGDPYSVNLTGTGLGLLNYYSTHFGKGFTESSANDGSVEGSININLTGGDTFQDEDNDDILDLETEVTIGNIPNGLTPTVTLSSSTLAILTLSGNASDHLAANSVSDITFTFTDLAFTNSNAEDIQNATGPASSYKGIEFIGVANDEPIDAITLTTYANNTGTYIEGTTKSAALFDGTLSCDEDGYINDVWYKFSSANIELIDINITLGTASSLSCAVYYPDYSQASFCVVGISDQISIPLPTNTDVYLQLWNSAADAGTFNIRANEPVNTWTFAPDFSSLHWTSGSAPTANDNARIMAQYSTEDYDNLEVKNLEIKHILPNNVAYENAALLSITNNNNVIVHGDLVNNGVVLVQSGGSLNTYGTVTSLGYSEENFTAFVTYRNTTFASTVGKYSIFGSPVQEAPFSSLGDNARIYGYDESQKYNPSGNQGALRFRTPNQLGQSTMAPGQGYFSAFSGDPDFGDVKFIGVPNNGTIAVNLSYTDQGISEEVDYQGFNLVSNPYPAAISLAKLMEVNADLEMDLSIYLWDDFGSDGARGSNADYLIANTLGATQTRSGNDGNWDGYIRSCQGFFMKVNAASQTLQFTDTMKVTDHNTDAGFFRTAQLSRYKLAIQDETTSKATIVGYTSDATLGKDKAYDAQMLNGSNLQIYTLQVEGETKLGIQGIPSDYEGEVKLGFKCDLSKNYTLALINIEEVSGSYMLYDAYKDLSIDLSKQTFVFASEIGEFNDRFTLGRINEVLSLTPGKAPIYAYNKILNIQSQDSQTREYRLYNLGGKQMMKTQVSGSTSINLGHLNNGIYLLSNGKETVKLILK
jgi:hypothetical protein